MGLIKFLLILFIVFYLFGYLGRFLLKRWLKKMSNNTMGTNGYSTREEGEVTINTKPGNSKNKKFNDGDYVDYEEIKD